MTDTLLVADDEYGIREFLYELFKDEFAVLLAENGQQAIDMLSSSIVDVALIDMRMPVKSGMDVLEFVNAEKLPVIPIVITADRDNPARGRRDEAGGVRLHHKTRRLPEAGHSRPQRPRTEKAS
jgi:DNA-binding NtrC family response regulator